MALTWDDITGKVNKHIIPRLVDNVYKSSPVFTRLRTRNAERFEGGTTIRHPIAYAELNGGAFQRGGSFNISYVQTDTALELNPKYYYVNVTLFGTDNVLARGPEAAMNYVESKMVNASGKMAKNLGTDLFLDGQGTNSGTINLDGLQAALDNGNSFTSYGGITRSDLGVANGTNNAGINCYADVATAVFTMSLLQTAYGGAWFGNEHVDLIVTTQTIWNIIWNKILPQQRFMEESTDVAKIGFQSMRWNGASICVDQYCPANYIWGLNTKYIQFWISTLPKYQFGFTGFKEAQNTDDVAGQYLFAGNLLVPAPRLMFKLGAITS
jgi:hypothetical protein